MSCLSCATWRGSHLEPAGAAAAVNKRLRSRGRHDRLGGGAGCARGAGGEPSSSLIVRPVGCAEFGEGLACGSVGEGIGGPYVGGKRNVAELGGRIVGPALSAVQPSRGRPMGAPLESSGGANGGGGAGAIGGTLGVLVLVSSGAATAYASSGVLGTGAGAGAGAGDDGASGAGRASSSVAGVPRIDASREPTGAAFVSADELEATRANSSVIDAG